jgi:hypothetical protein
VPELLLWWVSRCTASSELSFTTITVHKHLLLSHTFLILQCYRPSGLSWNSIQPFQPVMPSKTMNWKQCFFKIHRLKHVHYFRCWFCLPLKIMLPHCLGQSISHTSEPSTQQALLWDLPWWLVSWLLYNFALCEGKACLNKHKHTPACTPQSQWICFCPRTFYKQKSTNLSL